MKKFTKAQIKNLKKHWRKLAELDNDFRYKVDILEAGMQTDLKISDLEFFMCDGDYVGIGNMARTIKLLHDYELEKK